MQGRAETEFMEDYYPLICMVMNSIALIVAMPILRR